MAIKLGSTDISDIKLGDKHVSALYLGDKLVWEKVSSNYTMLEYIESNGTQWIELPFKPNNNSGVELDFLQTTKIGTGNMPIFGGRTTATGNSFACWFFSTNKLRSDYNTSFVENPDVNLNKRYLVFKNKNTLSVNGNLITTHPLSSFQSSNNLLMFSTPLRGANPNGYLKLYSAKIFDNDDLIFDLKPAQRKTDGAIGLLDVFNNVFYTNNGTGTFMYG